MFGPSSVITSGKLFVVTAALTLSSYPPPLPLRGIYSVTTLYLVFFDLLKLSTTCCQAFPSAVSSSAATTDNLIPLRIASSFFETFHFLFVF